MTELIVIASVVYAFGIVGGFLFGLVQLRGLNAPYSRENLRGAVAMAFMWPLVAFLIVLNTSAAILSR